MAPVTASGIDELLSSVVERGDAPGVAAVAADASGVVYAGAAGSRGGGPMAVDTVVWIASMTKAVTAVAALQRVEKGDLSLDEPLSEVLPELAELEVLTGFDAERRPQLRPATTPVTLRHLLAHTAGWAYDFWNADVAHYQAVAGVPRITACRNVTLANPLVSEPGTKWEYGPNIEWAGKAVERVSGQTLEEYLRQHVFAPLGMDDSGFVIGDHRARLAGMNARLPEGGTTPIELEIPQEPEFFMGGGGLYSTPEDYLKFLRMLLGRGELDGARILSEESVAEGRRNQIGDLSVGPILTVDPNASLDVDFLPTTTKKWGLFGMTNVEETPSGRSAGSLFWAGLSNCYYWVDWEKQNTGALFTQVLPFADPRILEAFDEFELVVRSL